MTWAPSAWDHGDVLLHRGVGGAGDKLSHLLAAAHHGDTAGFHESDDIAAVLTNIKPHNQALLNDFE